MAWLPFIHVLGKLETAGVALSRQGPLPGHIKRGGGRLSVNQSFLSL